MMTVYTVAITLKSGTTTTRELTHKQVLKLKKHNYNYKIIDSYNINEKDYNSITINNNF